MNLFVLFGDFATVTSISNGIEQLALNDTYLSALNKAAMDIFDTKITLPTGSGIDPVNNKTNIEPTTQPPTGICKCTRNVQTNWSLTCKKRIH